MVYIKNKKKLIIISILLIVLVIDIVLTIFIESNSKQNKVINDEIVYLNPDEIIDLLSYLPYSTVNSNTYQDMYCGDKVTSEDILPVILSPILLSNYHEIYVQDKSDFEDKLKKHNMEKATVYLTKNLEYYLIKKYNLKLVDIIANGDEEFKIKKLDNKYTAFLNTKAESFTILIKAFLSVTDAYSVKDETIITERVLFYELRNNKYYVYKNSNIDSKDNNIKTYDKIDKNGNELSYNDIFEKIKEDFVDYNYGFKHTFKKNDTGYYWYSTEYVKLDS